MIRYNVNLIFDCEEDKNFWKSRLYTVRECYNFVSKIVFNNRNNLNIKEIHHKCYKPSREKFPSLPAQMCVKIYRTVIAHYKTIKINKHHIVKPTQMKKLSIQLDKLLCSNLTQESFKLSSKTPHKRILVKFKTYPKFLEIAKKYRMCAPILVYNEKTDSFYLSIPFYPSYPTLINENVLGVDLGCKRFATLSTGKAFSDKIYLKQKRKIRYLKRLLQSKKKNSHSARKKLNKVSHKEKNITKNICHIIANEILKENEGIIVLEDLSNLKKNTSKNKNKYYRKKHNNYLSQFPFYTFKRILADKALLNGKKVETVSAVNTSQIDCRTQLLQGCIRKGRRFYTTDGLVFDSDWNAAINIALRKKLPISFDLPIDGKLNLIGRVCQRPKSETNKCLSCKFHYMN